MHLGSNIDSHYGLLSLHSDKTWKQTASAQSSVQVYCFTNVQVSSLKQRLACRIFVQQSVDSLAGSVV